MQLCWYIQLNLYLEQYSLNSISIDSIILYNWLTLNAWGTGCKLNDQNSNDCFIIPMSHHRQQQQHQSPAMRRHERSKKRKTKKMKKRMEPIVLAKFDENWRHDCRRRVRCKHITFPGMNNIYWPINKIINKYAERERERDNEIFLMKTRAIIGIQRYSLVLTWLSGDCVSLKYPSQVILRRYIRYMKQSFGDIRFWFSFKWNSSNWLDSWDVRRSTLYQMHIALKIGFGPLMKNEMWCGGRTDGRSVGFALPFFGIGHTHSEYIITWDKNKFCFERNEGWGFILIE